jgi:deoxyadenosine/deoxycytidine kinase
MPIITIDGNIGAGKTSILNYLHTNYNINVDLEPIDKWKPYLDNIYIDKKDYFKFLIRIWLDRSWIQEKNKSSIVIMERSPYFIRNTFNKYMYDINLINKNENTIINELYDKTDIIWKSNYFIYFRSSPEKCLEKIYKRGRENEMDITLEYLKNIHEYHERAYEELKDKKIVIDVDEKSLEEIGQEIYEFIHRLL